MTLVLPKKLPLVVVDASVAAKNFLPEERAVNAQDVLGYKAEEIAPSVINFEIASLLAKHYRVGSFTKEEAHELLLSWHQGIEDELIFIYPSTEYSHAAFVLACELKHPFYDCCYLALAQLHNCPMVTADRQLFGRGRTIYSNIILAQ